VSQVTKDRLLRIASAIGYGIGLAALITLIAHDGGYAYDGRVYWEGARRLIDGKPLYLMAELDSMGRYLDGAGPLTYPPLFAQAMAPFALLPELAFAWLWRGFLFLCLRYLAGSWRNVGLWLLFPLTITELSAANVTLLVGAATLASFMGRPYLAAWAGVLKYGGFLVVPYLWFARPDERRTLARGLGVLAAVILASLVFSPAEWRSYTEALGRQATSSLEASNLLRLLPTAAQDFALRLVVAIALLGYAIRIRSDRLAYVVGILTVPSLWVSRVVPLLATPRLAGARRWPPRHRPLP
jgi:hypothetical protein